jgi:7,8-dihydropterin-6-yl-methyl-4-(beta-D-ribofuranosyl)aminobenzene 5'-phosphate synthase
MNCEFPLIYSFQGLIVSNEGSNATIGKEIATGFLSSSRTIRYMPKRLRLSVVVDDSASNNPRILAEHGLCILLEIDLWDRGIMKLLLDTGATSDGTLHNIDTMGIDLRQTDLIVISHGHYDHTGGLVGVLQRSGGRTPVIAHPGICNPKLKTRPFLKFIGLPFTIQEAESAGATMLYSRSSVRLADGVFTTGEVARDTIFEKAEGFVTLEEGIFKEDAIIDDQALVINVQDKGLVVISGCAHSGIVNTVHQAQRMSGVSEIYAIAGGFHLHDAGDERLDSTVDEFIKLDPKILRPCHCTGSKAICRLLQVFGDRCKPLAAGDVINL